MLWFLLYRMNIFALLVFFNIYFVLCKVFLINSGHELQRCYVEDDFTKPQDLIKSFLVDG